MVVATSSVSLRCLPVGLTLLWYFRPFFKNFGITTVPVLMTGRRADDYTDDACGLFLKAHGHALTWCRQMEGPLHGMLGWTLDRSKMLAR
jgi:hypothetical protein